MGTGCIGSARAIGLCLASTGRKSVLSVPLPCLVAGLRRVVGNDGASREVLVGVMRVGLLLFFIFFYILLVRVA